MPSLPLQILMESAGDSFCNLKSWLDLTTNLMDRTGHGWLWELWFRWSLMCFWWASVFGLVLVDMICRFWLVLHVSWDWELWIMNVWAPSLLCAYSSIPAQPSFIWWTASHSADKRLGKCNLCLSPSLMLSSQSTMYLQLTNCRAEGKKQWKSNDKIFFPNPNNNPRLVLVCRKEMKVLVSVGLVRLDLLGLLAIPIKGKKSLSRRKDLRVGVEDGDGDDAVVWWENRISNEKTNNTPHYNKSFFPFSSSSRTFSFLPIPIHPFIHSELLIQNEPEKTLLKLTESLV